LCCFNNCFGNNLLLFCGSIRTCDNRRFRCRYRSRFRNYRSRNFLCGRFFFLYRSLIYRFWSRLWSRFRLNLRFWFRSRWCIYGWFLLCGRFFCRSRWFLNRHRRLLSGHWRLFYRSWRLRLRLRCWRLRLLWLWLRLR
jgi:hypothetical protein